MNSYTRESAERDIELMLGWDNPRVAVDPEPLLDGSEVVYLLAEDPISGRTVIWDSPQEEQARYL
jgi:hypothetical protein